jgi:hypothetical protein
MQTKMRNTKNTYKYVGVFAYCAADASTGIVLSEFVRRRTITEMAPSIIATAPSASTP